jgi:hypothetical protein
MPASGHLCICPRSWLMNGGASALFSRTGIRAAYRIGARDHRGKGKTFEPPGIGSEPSDRPVPADRQAGGAADA